ncbi:MFS transporter [Microbacterium sp.]|uniref:MFS transporter n=1 Tax=Microbacterium sp. TaxID=51671 RepID=UPI0039E5F489
MTTDTTDSVVMEIRSRLPIGPLLLLSFAVFLTVTVEALPAGLLTEMSGDLGTSADGIGLLISVWALTVIVTSIPLTRLLRRFDRRPVVAGALTVFAVANLATALSPTLTVALATRVAAAVAHGVFWAVVIVYATSLLPRSHWGRGLAIVTAGGTAATVIGLPLGTTLAQVVGWRWVFVAAAAAALLAAAAIAVIMPRNAGAPSVEPSAQDPETSGRDRSLVPLLVFGMAAVLIATGQFTSFTYIRPYLETAAGFDPVWAPPLLFAYGATGVIGVVLAGILADRMPRAALTATVALFVVAFAVLALLPTRPFAVVAALAVWGAAMGALFPLLQSTLMRVASDRTRTLASAGIVVFFNVGITIGPWLGGRLVEASAATPFVASAGLLLTAGALVVVGLGLARQELAKR